MSNLADLVPIVLLIVLGLSLGAAATMVYFVRRELRETRRLVHLRSEYVPARDFGESWQLTRPQSWLAVRSENLPAVQRALGLRHPKPCPCRSGLAGDEKLFIAPPLNGWILVTGSELPDPGDDVDACFRFLVETSRKLGHLQFFSANPVLHHHGWARVDEGQIVRAYAWAGTTVWNQGLRTRAEEELGLKCFEYAEHEDRSAPVPSEVVATNAEKVPLLAERWSFDPAHIDERFLERARGVAGEPSSRTR